MMGRNLKNPEIKPPLTNYEKQTKRNKRRKGTKVILGKPAHLGKVHDDFFQ